MPRLHLVTSSAAALLCAAVAQADLATWTQPDLDRWNYPFNGTPGSRTTGSTFGALGSQPAFDELDAQILLGFDTAAKGVPTGQGAANYLVTSVTLTATTSGADTFTYDPTYDSAASYRTGGTDADTGRPVHLFATGFRGGRTTLDFVGGNAASGPGYEEGESFGPAGPPAWQVRHAFAADVATGSVRDVSNFVDFSNDGDAGFEPTPFAIGQSALTAGSSVPQNTTFTFDVNLADANTLAYIQHGLNSGQLGFTLASLHPAAFGGAATYPSFWLDESGIPAIGGTPVTLAINYTVVPEPATASIVAASLVVLALRRRRSA